ncbi:MAG: hypothetical protein GQ527_01715 [Bacteroidales bacterium]|nr:hypothetical protein [Bacteroidales bacterium]
MKKMLFYLFIGILLFPAIQKQGQLFQFAKLTGSFVPVKDVEITTTTWFSAEYQSKKDKYIKDHIGFRPFFVRIYNQLLYSFFHLANNPGGVVGTQDYLYLESYIYNYTGENFIGWKNINSVATKLKFLQTYFAEKDISLITVIVPSKASFYPEYIPSRFKMFPTNNYHAYCQVFDSLQLDYLDLNKYILSMKDDSPYPLFSKNGLHWTSYGMALGMDTLIRKIEQARNVNLPDFSWEEPVYMEPMSFDTDFDAESLMNLYVDMPKAEMPYPKYIFGSDENKTTPKTIVISDSYYWRAYKEKIPHHILDWGGFWYYFNTARDEENGEEVVTPVKKYNLPEKLLEQDVIVLFASQATLHIFPFGFDKKVYPIFMPHDMESLLAYYKENIVANKEWKDGILRKAEQANRSFDEQLEKDAAWMARKFMKEKALQKK